MEMTWRLVASATLIGVCLGAVWFDLRERRIPNLLTVGGLAAALLLRIPGGLESVGSGLLGAAIGFGVALPFFLVGGLGGGDAKLLSTVGAFLGPEHVWTGLLVMAFSGGVLALAAIARKRAFRQTAANLVTIFTTFGSRTFTGWKGEESEAAVTLDTPGVITVPYGLAIAAGAMAGWFL